MTWALLAVITLSLAGYALPALGLAGDDAVFCPGILGLMGGCTALLIRLLRKDRGTQRPDWVSLIALCVVILSTAVVFLSLLPWMFASAVGGIDAGFWHHVEGDWILKLPTAVATLGYFVLLVRLLERALRRR